MKSINGQARGSHLWLLFVALFLVIAAALWLKPFQAANSEIPVATYSQGLLHLAIPYRGAHAGTGTLTVEILNPDDQILGQAEKKVDATMQGGQWQEEIKLEKALALEDLVWQRMRYRFDYEDHKYAALEGVESISQILRTPVVHVLGQQS
ncbi:MAG TPA: hypothetical protein VE263_06615, partial [Candidatus Angelobacter sp.]|nr:hypothetical protein [Candidatus Angelobacter sp.]